MDKKMTRKQFKRFKRLATLNAFLSNVVPNNKHNIGWNRAEDLGSLPEKQPKGSLLRFESGFRDGKDSGRTVSKAVVVWRY